MGKTVQSQGNSHALILESEDYQGAQEVEGESWGEKWMHRWWDLDM